MESDTGTDISKDWSLNASISCDKANENLTYYAEEESCACVATHGTPEGQVDKGQINMAVICAKDLLQREGVEIGFKAKT
jgi:hypothetical protein